MRRSGLHSLDMSGLFQQDAQVPLEERRSRDECLRIFWWGRTKLSVAVDVEKLSVAGVKEI